VLTRRWLIGVNVSRTWENGYLTEPYKVVSLLNANGIQTGTLREKRPDTRRRTSVQVNSAYHLTREVLSLSYRRYEDDWGVRSNTVDARYRIPYDNESWLEPHVRVYQQTAADFFHQGFRDNAPLPRYASADLRLGRLRARSRSGPPTGFRVGDLPGEWYVRAEYIGASSARRIRRTPSGCSGPTTRRP
jgi:hypothetical protein